MGVAEAGPLTDELPRCASCGAVIGVYEPVVQEVGGVPSTTSRAADASLSAASPGPLYHAGCYELMDRGAAG